MMLIGGQSAKVQNGHLKYAGQTRTLDGASATFTTQRRGIPFITRRTEFHVTITGDGWTVSGRAKPMPFPAWAPGRRVQGFINRVNGF